MANRKIACTIGRGRAYISDMYSTSGYMGAKYVQDFCPSLCFLDVSSACGYMGAKYFQKIGPRLWHDSQMDLDLNIWSLPSHGNVCSPACRRFTDAITITLELYESGIREAQKQTVKHESYQNANMF